MNSVARVRTLPRASPLESWATESVEPHLRADYWSHAVEVASGRALQVQRDARAQDVAGKITRHRLPDVHLAHLRANGLRLAGRRESPCPVLVLLDATHGWEARVGGEQQWVRAGQVAIVHVGAEVVLDFPEGIDAALLAGSAAWAQRWSLAGATDTPVRVCDADRGWGKILATALRELAQQPDTAAGESGAMVGELMGIAVAAAGRTEAAPRFSVDLVDEARRLCRQRLGDPALDASAVARTLGVSVRTLGRAFQEADTTFLESLREMRLQHATALLAEPELACLGVAEIGRRCGYVSASHFVREFRRRWGTTPGQARAGSAARQTQAEILCRVEQVLAETRLRVERQRTRVHKMSATQSLQLPPALDLLRNLEQSLAALEHVRATAEASPDASGPRGAG